MADKKITDLSEATALTDDDLLVVVDSPSAGAATKKITVANAKTSLRSGSIQPIEVILGGAGAVPSTGVQAEVHIHEAGNLTFGFIAMDQTGGMDLRIMKGTFALHPANYSTVIKLCQFSNAISATMGTVNVAVSVDDMIRFYTHINNTWTRALVSIRQARS